jgi:hypothetical protein
LATFDEEGARVTLHEKNYGKMGEKRKWLRFFVSEEVLRKYSKHEWNKSAHISKKVQKAHVVKRQKGWRLNRPKRLKRALHRRLSFSDWGEVRIEEYSILDERTRQSTHRGDT